MKFLKGIFIGLSIPVLGGLLIASYIVGNYQHVFEDTADCAVVFGAAVWKGDVPSHALYDRTMTGISLFQDEKVNCLIFSGGASTYGAHEADVMKKLAQDADVPEDKIYLDYEGTNTLATIKNLPIEKSFVFVSNDFHLARIKMIAWKLGIEDFSLHTAQYYQGRYLKEPYFFFREFFAVIFYGFAPL